jgi:hypothetical protein
MKLKTVSIDGEKSEKIYDGGLVGMSYLYPKGTKRTTVEYFLFPRTLKGETRRGLQVVEQRAGIEYTTDGETGFHYNDWEKVKFMGASLPFERDLVRKMMSNGADREIVMSTFNELTSDKTLKYSLNKSEVLREIERCELLRTAYPDKQEMRMASNAQEILRLETEAYSF